MLAALSLRPGSRSVAELATASLASCLERYAMADRVYITEHALDRYIERVEAVSRDEARRRIAGCERAILAAASIGCSYVVMPCRAKLALVGARVVSVYPVEAKRTARTGQGRRGLGSRIRRNEKGRQGWRVQMEGRDYD